MTMVAVGDLTDTSMFGYVENVETSDVGSITDSAAEVNAITVDVVDGMTYTIHWCMQSESSAADDVALALLWTGSVSGTQIGGSRLSYPAANKNFSFSWTTSYTATSTGSVTVYASLERESGSGTITRSASSSSQDTRSVTCRGNLS
jgi:hypothetical protein